MAHCHTRSGDNALQFRTVDNGISFKAYDLGRTITRGDIDISFQFQVHVRDYQ